MNKRKNYIGMIPLLIPIPVMVVMMIMSIKNMFTWEMSGYSRNRENVQGHPAPPIFTVIVGAFGLFAVAILSYILLLIAIKLFKRVRFNNTLYNIVNAADPTLPSEGEYYLYRTRVAKRFLVRYTILMMLAFTFWYFLIGRLAVAFVIALAVIGLLHYAGTGDIPEKICIDNRGMFFNDVPFEFGYIENVLVDVKKRDMVIDMGNNYISRIPLGSTDGTLDSTTLAILMTVCQACEKNKILFRFK